jgi:hypothetical protein
VACATARADTISFGSSTIEGEIVSETEDTIVVRIGNGRLTIPRRTVTRIVRTSGAREELAATRARDAAARARMEKAFLAAERFLDPRDRDEARTQLPAGKLAAWLLERGREHLARGEASRATGCLAAAHALEAGTWETRDLEAKARLQVYREAMAAGDGRTASAAIAPLAQWSERQDFTFLRARAEDLAGNEESATALYTLVLERGPGLSRLGANQGELLRALAELAIVAPGRLVEELHRRADMAHGWTRSSSEHLTIFAASERSFSPVELASFELDRTRVLARLGLVESDVPSSHRVVVFAFPSHSGLEALDLPTWADGCAMSRERPDGSLSQTVYVTLSRDGGSLEALPHELAHVFVADAFHLSLPSWATEGVAVYAEPEGARRWQLEIAREALPAGKLLPVETLFRSVTQDLDAKTASVFYAQSCVTFTHLVAKAGSVRRALEVASKLGGGPSRLLELGTTPEGLDAAVRASLAPVTTLTPVPVPVAPPSRRSPVGPVLAVLGTAFLLMRVRARARR